MDGSSDQDRPRSEDAGVELRRPARAIGRSSLGPNARSGPAADRALTKAALFQDIDPAIRLDKEPDTEPPLESTPDGGSNSAPAEPPPSVEPPLGADRPAAVEPPPPDASPVAAEPLAPLGQSPPASEAELAGIVLLSRREARSHPRFGHLGLGLLKAGAVRAGLLVAFSSGALYAGFLAVKPGEALTAATVRQPRMMTVKSIPVEAVPASASSALRVVPYADSHSRAFALSPSGPVAGFVRVVPGTPEEACATLVDAGWASEGWGDSPVSAEGECLAERQYGADGTTNNFAVLRGGDTLSELRIKLNLGDTTTRAAAARDAGRLVAMLFRNWRWTGAEVLEQRITALEPFELTVLGTTVRLSREYGETERLNLFLRFPPPPGTPLPDFARTKEGSLIALAKVVGLDGAAGAKPPGPALP